MATAKKSTHELIEECQGMVKALAWKVHRALPKQVEVDDLIGYGQVGLAQAAEAYETGRGAKFSTFAYYRIRGAIYDGIAEMSWFRKKPHHLTQYDQMANDVLQAESDDAPKSEALPMEQEASWFQSVVSALAVAHLTCKGESGDETREQTLVDPAAISPSEAIDSKELREGIREVVKSLPADERTLIESAYFSGINLRETAEQMGISKSWASRLHAKALKRIAKSMAQLGMAS